MADLKNLLRGDSVRWVLKNELVYATVKEISEAQVLIEFEGIGGKQTRWVPAKALRLIYGGKKRLKREAAQWRAAEDFVKAYSVGPQKLREVFEREKAAGNVSFDYGEMELAVLAYEEKFPRLKELKGKNL